MAISGLILTLKVTIQYLYITLIIKKAVCVVKSISLF